MSCNKPLVAYRIRDKIVFNPENADSPYTVAKPFNLPCGKCWKCRLTYARTWAIRCMHEAKGKKCAFLTLTYDPEHLPPDGSLNVRHFQLFMKKLRNKTKIKKLRFFHSGEYGEKLGRPHYHALIFGYDFPDKEYFKSSKPSPFNNNKKDKFPLYQSEEFNELWHYGYAIIGDVTFQSASYVARYIMKKINGDQSQDHYSGKKPEYCTMSRRPAIGKEWYENNGWQSCHANDKITVEINDKYYYLKPPRYYDELYKQQIIDKASYTFPYPDDYEIMKEKRIEKQDDVTFENYLAPSSRLYQLDKAFENKIKKQIRQIEIDT